MRKPELFNNGRFDDKAWEVYSNNPKNKGLRVGMIENMSKTTPNAYSRTYKGIQERLTNSAIDVAHQQGYEGVVSGEVLLSPEKTTHMYPKYRSKKSSVQMEDTIGKITIQECQNRREISICWKNLLIEQL